MKPDAIFKALSDPTRRRLLQVLAGQELSVGELVEVLDQPQSTVSRHLKMLREADLVSERRNGATSYLAGAATTPDGKGGTLAASLLEWVQREAIPKAMDRRIRSVIDRRRMESSGFFEQIGERWDQLRSECFGTRFHLEALTALMPHDWTVADIGTGTGFLLPTLAATFKRVIAVEPVAAVMEIAKGRPELAAAKHVEFRMGDLGRLPIADGEVDLAITMLVLHHVAEPPLALSELARITRPGGRLLIVEQKPHHLKDFHKRMSDLWWGFEPEQLAAQARAAGFDNIVHRDLTTAAPQGKAVLETPDLFVMTGRRVGQ